MPFNPNLPYDPVTNNGVPEPINVAPPTPVYNPNVPSLWQGNQQGYQVYQQQTQQAEQLRQQSQIDVNRVNKVASSTGGHGLTAAQTASAYAARYPRNVYYPNQTSQGYYQQGSQFFDQHGQAFTPTVRPTPIQQTPQKFNSGAAIVPNKTQQGFDFFGIKLPEFKLPSFELKGMWAPQTIKPNVANQIATMFAQPEQRNQPINFSIPTVPKIDVQPFVQAGQGFFNTTFGIPVPTGVKFTPTKTTGPIYTPKNVIGFINNGVGGASDAFARGGIEGLDQWGSNNIIGGVAAIYQKPPAQIKAVLPVAEVMVGKLAANFILPGTPKSSVKSQVGEGVGWFATAPINRPVSGAITLGAGVLTAGALDLPIVAGFAGATLIPSSVPVVGGTTVMGGIGAAMLAGGISDVIRSPTPGKTAAEQLYYGSLFGIGAEGYGAIGGVNGIKTIPKRLNDWLPNISQRPVEGIPLVRAGPHLIAFEEGGVARLNPEELKLWNDAQISNVELAGNINIKTGALIGRSIGTAKSIKPPNLPEFGRVLSEGGSLQQINNIHTHPTGSIHFSPADLTAMSKLAPGQSTVFVKGGTGLTMETPEKFGALGSGLKGVLNRQILVKQAELDILESGITNRLEGNIGIAKKINSNLFKIIDVNPTTGIGKYEVLNKANVPYSQFGSTLPPMEFNTGSVKFNPTPSEYKPIALVGKTQPKIKNNYGSFLTPGAGLVGSNAFKGNGVNIPILPHVPKQQNNSTPNSPFMTGSQELSKVAPVPSTQTGPSYSGQAPWNPNYTPPKVDAIGGLANAFNPIASGLNMIISSPVGKQVEDKYTAFQTGLSEKIIKMEPTGFHEAISKPIENPTMGQWGVASAASALFPQLGMVPTTYANPLVRSFIAGQFQGLEEKPVDTALLFAVTFALPEVGALARSGVEGSPTLTRWSTQEILPKAGGWIERITGSSKPLPGIGKLLLGEVETKGPFIGGTAAKPVIFGAESNQVSRMLNLPMFFAETTIGGMWARSVLERVTGKPGTTTEQFIKTPGSTKTWKDASGVTWSQEIGPEIETRTTPTRTSPFQGKALLYGFPIITPGNEIKASDFPSWNEMFRESGKITSTELIPAVVGLAAGDAFWTRANSYLENRGLISLNLEPKKVTEARNVQNRLNGYANDINKNYDLIKEVTYEIPTFGQTPFTIRNTGVISYQTEKGGVVSFFLNPSAEERIVPHLLSLPENKALAGKVPFMERLAADLPYQIAKRLPVDYEAAHGRRLALGAMNQGDWAGEFAANTYLGLYTEGNTVGGAIRLTNLPKGTIAESTANFGGGEFNMGLDLSRIFGRGREREGKPKIGFGGIGEDLLRASWSVPESVFATRYKPLEGYSPRGRIATQRYSTSYGGMIDPIGVRKNINWFDYQARAPNVKHEPIVEPLLNPNLKVNFESDMDSFTIGRTGFQELAGKPSTFYRATSEQNVHDIIQAGFVQTDKGRFFGPQKTVYTQFFPGDRFLGERAVVTGEVDGGFGLIKLGATPQAPPRLPMRIVTPTGRETYIVAQGPHASTLMEMPDIYQPNKLYPGAQALTSSTYRGFFEYIVPAGSRLKATGRSMLKWEGEKIPVVEVEFASSEFYSGLDLSRIFGKKEGEKRRYPTAILPIPKQPFVVPEIGKIKLPGLDNPKDVTEYYAVSIHGKPIYTIGVSPTEGMQRFVGTWGIGKFQQSSGGFKYASGIDVDIKFASNTERAIVGSIFKETAARDVYYNIWADSFKAMDIVNAETFVPIVRGKMGEHDITAFPRPMYNQMLAELGAHGKTSITSGSRTISDVWAGRGYGRISEREGGTLGDVDDYILNAATESTIPFSHTGYIQLKEQGLPLQTAVKNLISLRGVKEARGDKPDYIAGLGGEKGFQLHGVAPGSQFSDMFKQKTYLVPSTSGGLINIIGPQYMMESKIGGAFGDILMEEGVTRLLPSNRFGKDAPDLYAVTRANAASAYKVNQQQGQFLEYYSDLVPKYIDVAMRDPFFEARAPRDKLLQGETVLTGAQRRMGEIKFDILKADSSEFYAGVDVTKTNKETREALTTMGAAVVQNKTQQGFDFFGIKLPEFKLPTFELKGMWAPQTIKPNVANQIATMFAPSNQNQPINFSIPTLPKIDVQPFVQAGQGFFNTVGLGAIVEAGKYAGRENYLNAQAPILSAEASGINQTIADYKQQGKLVNGPQGLVFNGTPEEYSGLNQKIDAFNAKQSLFQNIQGQQEAYIQKITPNKMSPITTQIADFTRGGAAWWNENVAAPYTKGLNLGPATVHSFGPLVLLQPNNSNSNLNGIYISSLANSPGQLYEFGGMIPGGAETLGKNWPAIPAIAAYGTYKMGADMFTGITTKPVETAASLIGQTIILHGAGKVLKTSNPFSFETIDIPRGAGQIKYDRIIGEGTIPNANRYTIAVIKNPFKNEYSGGKIIGGVAKTIDKVPGAWARPLKGTFEILGDEGKVTSTKPFEGKTYTKPFTGNPKEIMEHSKIDISSGRQWQEGDVPWSRGTSALMRPYLEATAKQAHMDVWRGGGEIQHGVSQSSMWQPQIREPFGQVGTPAVTRAGLNQIIGGLSQEGKGVISGGSRASKVFAGEGFRDVTKSDFDTYVSKGIIQDQFNKISDITRKTTTTGNIFPSNQIESKSKFMISTAKNQEFFNAHVMEEYPTFATKPVKVPSVAGSGTVIKNVKAPIRNLLPDIDSSMVSAKELKQATRNTGAFYHATDIGFTNKIKAKGKIHVGGGAGYDTPGLFFGPEGSVYTQFLTEGKGALSKPALVKIVTRPSMPNIPDRLSNTNAKIGVHRPESEVAMADSSIYKPGKLYAGPDALVKEQSDILDNLIKENGGGFSLPPKMIIPGEKPIMQSSSSSMAPDGTVLRSEIYSNGKSKSFVNGIEKGYGFGYNEFLIPPRSKLYYVGEGSTRIKTGRGILGKTIGEKIPVVEVSFEPPQAMGEVYVMNPRIQIRAKIGGMLSGWKQEPGKQIKLVHNPKRVKDVVDSYSLSRAMAADLYIPRKWDVGGILTKRQTGMAQTAEGFSSALERYAETQIKRDPTNYATYQELKGQIKVDLLKGVNRKPTPGFDVVDIPKAVINEIPIKKEFVEVPATLKEQLPFNQRVGYNILMSDNPFVKPLKPIAGKIINKQYEIRGVDIVEEISDVNKNRDILNTVGKPNDFYHGGTIDFVNEIRNKGSVTVKSEYSTGEDAGLFFARPNTLYNDFAESGVIRLKTSPIYPKAFSDIVAKQIQSKKKPYDLGRNIMDATIGDPLVAPPNKLYPGPKPLAGFTYGIREWEYVVPNKSKLYYHPTQMEILTKGTKYENIGRTYIKNPTSILMRVDKATGHPIDIGTNPKTGAALVTDMTTGKILQNPNTVLSNMVFKRKNIKYMGVADVGFEPKQFPKTRMVTKYSLDMDKIGSWVGEGKANPRLSEEGMLFPSRRAFNPGRAVEEGTPTYKYRETKVPEKERYSITPLRSVGKTTTTNPIGFNKPTTAPVSTGYLNRPVEFKSSDLISTPSGINTRTGTITDRYNMPSLSTPGEIYNPIYKDMVTPAASDYYPASQPKEYTPLAGMVSTKYNPVSTPMGNKYIPGITTTKESYNPIYTPKITTTKKSYNPLYTPKGTTSTNEYSIKPLVSKSEYKPMTTTKSNKYTPVQNTLEDITYTPTRASKNNYTPNETLELTSYAPAEQQKYSKTYIPSTINSPEIYAPKISTEKELYSGDNYYPSNYYPAGGSGGGGLITTTNNRTTGWRTITNKLITTTGRSGGGGGRTGRGYSNVLLTPPLTSSPTEITVLIEGKREVKRRKRRGVLVSQFNVKVPVPRLSQLLTPMKFKYNKDPMPFNLKRSGTKVIVETFPGGTEWLRKGGRKL